MSCRQPRTYVQVRKALQKKDFKERRAREVLADAAEAGKSIRYARRDFANRKTALRNPRENHLRFLLCRFHHFDSHVGFVPSEGRWTCHSRGSPVRVTTCYHVGKKSWAPSPERIRSEHLEHLKNHLLVLVNTGKTLHTLLVAMQGS
ncbi:hypothetical protein RB195_008119 [Necator americanus]|uniref:Uncharacterized protein n=1 Tax=Necator americanus TaxID=51031 RepID=A0ABR1CQG7_NECAM